MEDHMSTPAARAIQAETLQKYIDGWSGWTVDGFLASWSEDCTQQSLPFSSGKPLLSRAQAEQLFPHLMSVMTDFKVTMHNIVHDAAHSKAVIYAMTQANTPFGQFNNEHAVFLWFDGSGKYVEKIEEMFDAVAMKDFLPKISHYVAQQKGVNAGATMEKEATPEQLEPEPEPSTAPAPAPRGQLDRADLWSKRMNRAFTSYSVHINFVL